jgi:hypothetical protein
MAKKKAGSYTDFTLKYVDFSHNERKRYSQWETKRTIAIEDAIGEIIDAHMKLSISIHPNDGVYLISVTPKDANFPGHGVVFIFRHVDLLKVVRMATYYLFEIVANGGGDIEPDDTLTW